MIEVGAQYFRPPNPPRADWARDLRRMREAGFTTVKLWAVWGWMHHPNGAIDFDELDELLDLAAENELRVVVNTILESAPYWLQHRTPEARYLDHEGRPVHLTAGMTEPGGGWPGLCLHHPSAKAEAGRFLEAVAHRYADHAALMVWDAWNEPRMEPASYYPERLYCYCDASLAAFAEWLRDRYWTLDALNAAWERRYTQWDEVAPPRRFEAIPDMLDWREFWFQTLARWLEWRVQRIRAGDPHRPVMTHVAVSGHVGQLATHTNDEFTLTSPVDMFGTSSFPTWLMDDDLCQHALQLDTARDAAPGKVVWQSELQGGRGRRLGRDSTPHPTPDSIRLWMWNALAAGAKAILFWQWRPELLGPESPGYGLCQPDGTPTERVAAAADMARLLQRHPTLTAAQPEPPAVGLLLSRRTALLCYATDRDMGLYASAISGSYRALFDADIPVTLVHEDAIRAHGVPEHLSALYWPLPMVADEPLTTALTRFVASGGRLVAECSPGQHSPTGRHATQLPGAGLDDLFGVRSIDTDMRDRIEIILPDDRRIEGAWQIEHLELTTASAVASFAEGGPAVTTNTHGKGQAVLAATYPSLAANADTGAWLADALLPAGRQTPFQWHTPGLGRYHRLLSTADGWRAVIAINATPEHGAFGVNCDDPVAVYGCDSDEAGAQGGIPPRSGRLIVLRPSA
jgi:beta-galactosidase GanA